MDASVSQPFGRAPLPGARVPRTAVLIPCYNEAPTVGAVVKAFLEADPGVTVYVYDNNSTDDTARIAAEAGAVVVREHQQGKGRVVRSMFRDVDADVYVMVDGDDTYAADAALAMREHVLDGSADLVIGDRLSSTYFEENKRRFHGEGNRLVRFLVNRLFGSRLHDIMTGCRCMSRMFVKTMPVMSSGFEIETEITIHALDKGFLVKEVPVPYRDRGEGSESKLSTVPDGIRVLRMLLRLFRDYRPMRFFGAVSVLLLVPAFVMFIVPLIEYLQTGLVSKFPRLIVSVAVGLGSMLSFAIGVLLDSIRTHSRQTFELQLTAYRETEDLRESCRS